MEEGSKEFKVHVMSNFQEICAGKDASASVRPKNVKPQPKLRTTEYSDGDYRRFKALYDDHIDLKYDHGNNNWFMRQNKYVIGAINKRIKNGLGDIFHEFGDENTVVIAGHGHQIKALHKYLVPKDIQKIKKWWTDDREATGVWGCHDKLRNGGAVKFNVKQIVTTMTGCLGRQKTKISYEMVPGTWEQFAEKGLFTEKRKRRRIPSLVFSRACSSSANSPPRLHRTGNH